MKTVALLFAAAAQVAQAAPAPIVCPERAPAEWQLAKVRLERVRILGYLPGDTLPENALPEGPPDKQWIREQYLFQSWDVTAGRPPMIYQADCVYTGTERFLRLDLSSAKQCTARWERKGERVKPGSLSFHCE